MRVEDGMESRYLQSIITGIVDKPTWSFSRVLSINVKLSDKGPL
jgi:hypothetical protein